MPTSNPRISTVVDNDLAAWLQLRAKTDNLSVSALVREVLTSFYEDEEERYWASEGEARLVTFDEGKTISHAEAWD